MFAGGRAGGPEDALQAGPGSCSPVLIKVFYALELAALHRWAGWGWGLVIIKPGNGPHSWHCSLCNCRAGSQWGPFASLCQRSYAYTAGRAPQARQPSPATQSATCLLAEADQGALQLQLPQAGMLAADFELRGCVKAKG